MPRFALCGRGGDIDIVCFKTRVHPQHVAIYGRFGLVVGNTQNSACRIIADAGQRKEALSGVRQYAPKLSGNTLGRFVQIFGCGNNSRGPPTLSRPRPAGPRPGIVQWENGL